MAFFGTDAGEGAGGIDEGDDREAERVGHLHQAKGLAVAFRIRAAEVAAEVFLGVAAFLLAEDHDRTAFEESGATDDGLVVHVQAVAMQLLEVVEQHADVVQGVGATGVAGQLDALPGVQVAVDLAAGLLHLDLEGLDLLGDVHPGGLGRGPEGVDLVLELPEGLFEFEGEAGLGRGHGP